MLNPKLLLDVDSYKVSHIAAMNPKITTTYAYLESRGGAFGETVFFGLQYYLRAYLEGVRFTMSDIIEAQTFWERHFGRDDVFDIVAWTRLLEKHEGRLPIRICAVEEGTIAPTHTVLLTMENTDPEFPWLTMYVEDLILKLWAPITVASQSHYLRQQIRSIGLDVSDDIDAAVDFMVHDFGYRGVSSEESAALLGAAHLLSFKGTDNVKGIRLLQEYYDDSPLTPTMSGFSIPATEHSIILGFENEEDAFAHYLDTFKDGMIACVSDTVDYKKAVTELWGGRFKNDLINRKGRLVIRPDSGDPREIVVWTLHELANIFGYTENKKGYRVLPDYVRIIQGDGMNRDSILALYKAIVEAGYAPENVATGSGGGLLQAHTRDTLRFAYKPSEYTYKNGAVRAVSKNPATDPTKKSKSGRFAVVDKAGRLETVPWTPSVNGANLLTPVFEDGEMLRETTYDGIIAHMRGN